MEKEDKIANYVIYSCEHLGFANITGEVKDYYTLHVSELTSQNRTEPSGYIKIEPNYQNLNRQVFVYGFLQRLQLYFCLSSIHICCHMNLRADPT